MIKFPHYKHLNQFVKYMLKQYKNVHFTSNINFHSHHRCLHCQEFRSQLSLLYPQHYYSRLFADKANWWNIVFFMWKKPKFISCIPYAAKPGPEPARQPCQTVRKCSPNKNTSTRSPEPIRQPTASSGQRRSIDSIDSTAIPCLIWFLQVFYYETFGKWTFFASTMLDWKCSLWSTGKKAWKSTKTCSDLNRDGRQRSRRPGWREWTGRQCGKVGPRVWLWYLVWKKRECEKIQKYN